MHSVVLEYHDVIDGGDFESSGFPGGSAASYKMDAPRFAEHLATIKEGGYPKVGGRVEEFSALRPDARPIIFTFDDGGRSALTTIAPLLEAQGWIGHFLMTTSRIGAPGFLGADDMRELVARGHVIGSHSHSHPTRMSALTPSELADEWGRSATLLAEILGTVPTVASVPGGYHADHVAVAAAAAGVKWLFTSEPTTALHHVDGCAVLGRYTLRRASPASEVRSLVAVRGLARARQWALWNGKKAVKRAAGTHYLALRSFLFGDKR